jgi:Protein of unknown function (DUF3768)
MAGSLEARRTPGDPSLLSVARLALLAGGEADRDDKCEIGIGDIWRRRWKRRGAHNHGKHDFGSFEVDSHTIFFKIDYFDKSRSYHSPDPSDPSVTERVITIMLSEEY